MQRPARIYVTLVIMENGRRDTKFSAVWDDGFCVIKVSASTMPTVGFPLSPFCVCLRI